MSLRSLKSLFAAAAANFPQLESLFPQFALAPAGSHFAPAASSLITHHSSLASVAAVPTVPSCKIIPFSRIFSRFEYLQPLINAFPTFFAERYRNWVEPDYSKPPPGFIPDPLAERDRAERLRAYEQSLHDQRTTEKYRRLRTQTPTDPDPDPDPDSDIDSSLRTHHSSFPPPPPPFGADPIDFDVDDAESPPPDSS